MLSVIKLLLFT